MSSREEQIAWYEKQIAEYPQGRMIRRLEGGRLRVYYEDGGFSFPVPEDMVHKLRSAIHERKFMQMEFLDMQREESRARYAGTLYIGDDLRVLAASVAGLQRRDCRADLERYLYGDMKEAVCAVLGLRGTGKTTLMLQAIMDMTDEDFSRTAYYAADRRQTCCDVWSCLESLSSQGVRYAFVDNITSMDDFIDDAVLFETLHTEKGMKVVLSGQEPSSFYITKHNALFDNQFTVHTTCMSFAEYSRLTGIRDRDYYLEHGGVLYPSFEEKDLQDYIEKSVAMPIEHLLMTWKVGYRKGPAEDLMDADEYRPFLHRLVDKATMDFLFSVIASQPMPQADRDILHDAVLHEYLRRNDEEYTADDADDLEGAKCWSFSYMEGMDFFHKGKNPDYRIAVQPGIRYMLSRSMLHGALEHEPFVSCTQEAKDELCRILLRAVKEKMWDDLAYYESTLAK